MQATVRNALIGIILLALIATFIVIALVEIFLVEEK